MNLWKIKGNNDTSNSNESTYDINHIPQIFNYKAKSLACLGSTNVENWDAVLSVFIFWAKYSFTLVYIYYFIYIYIYIYIYIHNGYMNVYILTYKTKCEKKNSEIENMERIKTLFFFFVTCELMDSWWSHDPAKSICFGS